MTTDPNATEGGRHGDDDRLLDAMEAASAFADRNWARGSNVVRPSSVMVIRYCNLMTLGEVSAARDVGERWLAGLRAEWRAEHAA